jgi:hypothetical protein
MRRMQIFFILVLAMFTVSPAFTERQTTQVATGGNQFLDGIGETALIARYVFNGNAEDWSRNTFHAALRGSGAGFVQDSRFGNVLNLPGNGSYVQLPGNTLTGEDTISITGWLFLNSNVPGQRFFDFGQNAGSSLYAAATDAGLRASIGSFATSRTEPTGAPVPANQWLHLAVVLDPANRTLTGYLNGVRAGQATNVTMNGAQVLNQASGDANRLYIGRSQNDADATLNARVYDVRIYRVALTDAQITTIRNNAPASRQSGGGPGGGRGPAVVPIAPPKETVLLTAIPLEAVPDIKAETIVGTLPRLPQAIPAVYRNRAKGPDVRVVWPSPKDNSQVLAPGTYTITGKVPGTQFQPKAMVTVKAATKDVPAPQRMVEAFPLGQVVLDQDTRGRDTQFIKNRDKFIRTLATTNPDNFLYNFRDAFGQKQPEGVKQLGGWDNQTTRLRGHATGHYLSAIAQAYAGTTYNEALRANFLQ